MEIVEGAVSWFHALPAGSGCRASGERRLAREGGDAILLLGCCVLGEDGFNMLFCCVLMFSAFWYRY
jgi:hypothetical protein